MAISRSTLLVELLMSADRVTTAARESAPRPDDEWSCATILGHLAQVDHEVWLPRIDVMVAAQEAGTDAVFTWWEPDATATAARFRDAAIDDTAALLLASRTALLNRLRHLGDEEWAATAEHETWGAIDVEGLMLQALAHDEEHRASILLGQAEV